jgi:hypothetical protein
MKPKAVILSITILLIGLLYATGEARMTACLEMGEIKCYCCTGKGVADSAETLSPCFCPCPGADQVFPFPQDFLAAPVPLEVNLLRRRMALTPDPILLNYFSLTPRKPPPDFFNPRSLFQSRTVPEE